MQTYVWVCLILFLAGFTQGFSGFGAVLISIPLLSLLLDIKVVIPLAALAALVITLIILVQLRHHLEWKKIFPLIVSSLPGIAAGVYFLKKVDQSIIHIILGTTIIIYSLYSLFSKKPFKGIRPNWAYFFGFLSGCMGGAFSASGPPVIVYTSLSSWSKDQIKVTLQGYFLLSGFFVVAGQAAGGLTTMKVLRLFAASIPALALGTYLGSLCYGMIPETGYRRILLIMLAALGLFMAVRI